MPVFLFLVLLALFPGEGRGRTDGVSRYQAARHGRGRGASGGKWGRRGGRKKRKERKERPCHRHRYADIDQGKKALLVLCLPGDQERPWDGALNWEPPTWTWQRRRRAAASVATTSGPPPRSCLHSNGRNVDSVLLRAPSFVEWSPRFFGHWWMVQRAFARLQQRPAAGGHSPWRLLFCFVFVGFFFAKYSGLDVQVSLQSSRQQSVSLYS